MIKSHQLVQAADHNVTVLHYSCMIYLMNLFNTVTVVEIKVFQSAS